MAPAPSPPLPPSNHHHPPVSILTTRRFAQDESISGSAQLKSSVVRGIKAQLLEHMSAIAPVLEDILPKKSPLYEVKWCDRRPVPALNRSSSKQRIPP